MTKPPSSFLLAYPKSVILTVRGWSEESSSGGTISLPREMMMFAGVRSLCTIPLSWCMYRSARQSWVRICQTSLSEHLWFLATRLLMRTSKDIPPAYSIAM